MKRVRYSTEQIVAALKQHDLGEGSSLDMPAWSYRVFTR